MVHIVAVPPPTSVADPNTWAVLADTALWNAESVAMLGYADLTDTDTGAVRWAVPSSARRTERWIALLHSDDRSSVVASGALSLPLRDNLAAAAIFVVVAPEHRRRGIGTRLLATAEQRAAELGRSTLHVWGSQPGQFDPAAADALVPAEGSGAIDRNSAEAQFLLKHGYALEQVEVHSMLRTPVPAEVIDPLEADAAAKVGDDYRLLAWSGECPEEIVPAFAELRVAMIDAPTAGIEYEAETWDAARVREVEQRVREAGLLSLTCAAQHVATGELAGYTELQRFAERADSAFQEDTVVIAGHRGHRLGMWLKAANLRRLDQEWPDVRRVHTWNADENDHMRSINIALGFRPESSGTGWQKVVRPH